MMRKHVIFNAHLPSITQKLICLSCNIQVGPRFIPHRPNPNPNSCPNPNLNCNPNPHSNPSYNPNPK